SNSSDPYPQVPAADERKLCLTREALRLLADSDMGILLQTKSDLFPRDLDVLSPGRTVIGVTITTADPALAARLEPGMPSPQARLAAVRAATAAGFPALVRVDPLIVGLNAEHAGLRELVDGIAAAGARQVVSSTVKLQPQSRQRLLRAFPGIAATLPRYSESQGRGNYRQLPLTERRELLEPLRELVLAAGMHFSVCREAGLQSLNTTACDGRGLT
ncbi:MAG: radical SAM protein, partial [Armatimonadetes bacterium]|nr:radical SAM protein [Armatimonadota bacterium]